MPEATRFAVRTRGETEVISGGHGFLEGPRWHAGRLYASDMSDHEVLSLVLLGRNRTGSLHGARSPIRHRLDAVPGDLLVGLDGGPPWVSRLVQTVWSSTPISRAWRLGT